MMAPSPKLDANRVTWAKFNQYIADCTRFDIRANIGSITYLEPMNDDLHEYRYEQRGGEYTLRCWHNGTERTQRFDVAHMPEWLRAILDTARVAGAIKPIKEPPPEIILWFRTDDKYNLTEFIEMK